MDDLVHKVITDYVKWAYEQKAGDPIAEGEAIGNAIRKHIQPRIQELTKQRDEAKKLLVRFETEVYNTDLQGETNNFLAELDKEKK